MKCKKLPIQKNLLSIDCHGHPDPVVSEITNGIEPLHNDADADGGGEEGVAQGGVVAHLRIE